VQEIIKERNALERKPMIMLETSPSGVPKKETEIYASVNALTVLREVYEAKQRTEYRNSCIRMKRIIDGDRSGDRIGSCGH